MSTGTLSPSHSARPAFFVVAVPKLIFMTLFTSGLYWLFWYLRNWELYREANGYKVMLWPRVLWPELFLYSLLSRVDRRIRASGRFYPWSPWWLACGLLSMTCSQVCLGMVILPMPELAPVALMLTAVLCLLQGRVQRGINYCEGDPEGEGNSQLTLMNWLWISVVTTGWLVLDWLS